MFGVMSDYALYKVNLSYPDNEITLLAPVPTYGEYNAMQSLAQNGESAIDTNKRLCKKIEELQKQLAEHRENCCCLENEKLRLDKAKLEDHFVELTEKVKRLEKEVVKGEIIIGKMLNESNAVAEENKQLCDLLRECLAHLSLGEIGTSVTPLNILLTSINAALGKSEER